MPYIIHICHYTLVINEAKQLKLPMAGVFSPWICVVAGIIQGQGQVSRPRQHFRHVLPKFTYLDSLKWTKLYSSKLVGQEIQIHLTPLWKQKSVTRTFFFYSTELSTDGAKHVDIGSCCRKWRCQLHGNEYVQVQGRVTFITNVGRVALILRRMIECSVKC